MGSCETSESNDPVNVDPLVGTWNIYSQKYDDGSEEMAGDCEKRSNFVFKSDKTGEANLYEENSSDECVLVETLSLVWESGVINVDGQGGMDYQIEGSTLEVFDGAGGSSVLKKS